MGWRAAILSVLLCLSPVSAQAGASHAATVETLLAEKPSSQRDQRLYDFGASLYHAIERGTEPDVDGARAAMARAYRAAADGGHATAWLDLGRCLWNGWGVPQDREAALASYKKSAALGLDYAGYVAAYNLYWNFKRYDEAHAYALKSLKGDTNGDAHYLLGLMAYTGRGRPKDIKESLRLHQQAARLGNADAMFELYVFSMNGIGDRETAAIFLQEAAKLEQPRAMANLGVYYATGGLGFPKDLEESVKWYRRAADKGHAQATATLGLMTLRGEGTPKDAAAAEALFERADELGFDVGTYLRKNGIERP
jgi:TPR repeat protein